MVAKKSRRGIAGERTAASLWSHLGTIAEGLLSCRRSVADYGRRCAEDLSITVRIPLTGPYGVTTSVERFGGNASS